MSIAVDTQLLSYEREDYSNIELIKMLRLSHNYEDFNKILLNFGFFLKKSRNKNDEDSALQKLCKLISKVTTYEYEKRKNSRVNKIIKALKNNDNNLIASTIASAYRTYLSECSMIKSQISVYGYICNGGHRQVKHNKFKEELCEWCHKPIMVQTNKNFICPLCGVYFQKFKPQRIKIKPHFENFYLNDFDKNEEICEVLNKIKTGEYELKKVKKRNAGQLVFIIDSK